MGNEKKRLLEDADAGAGDALTVNAAFARAFEARKRKEELSRLDRRGLNESEDESTSESEDEDGEELTPELDADIQRTLRLIRKKDPAIYDPSIAFFEDKPGSDDEEEEEEARSKPKKNAPLYYKDLVRRQVIAGDVDSDDEELAPVRTFKEEQDALRKEFLASVDKEDGSDDGDDDDGEGGLFKLRAKSANDADEDDDDDDLPTSKYGTKVKSAELDPDAFLEHYVSTEGWKDKSAAVPHYDDIVNDEEDAEELEKAENFEHAYNFRFEEDGGGEIQTHSRHIEDSMRRVDDSRKRKREERKARKALERQKKEEELRRLKNLKQAEIQAKLEKVAKLMGEKSAKNGSQNEKERLAALADDLDADFDPEEYDKRMQAIFDEEYYQEDEANAGEIEKPTWDEEEDKALFAGLPVDPDDEDETEPMEQDEDEKEEDDEVEDKEAEDDADEEEEAEEEETEGGSDEDNEQDEEDFANMSVEEMQRAKQKYLDELYSLDYEDLIGDIKCRFKYKQVHTNNFGLTVDEIMAADDKELKQLVSLKRLAPYVEDEYEVDRKKLKRFRKSIQEARAEKEEAKQAKAKRKAEAAEKEEPVADSEEKPKKKRKRAKKSKAQESKDESVEATKGEEEEEEVGETKESSKTESKQDGKKKRRSKKKKGGDKAAALASTGLSTSRLESYKLLKSK